METLIKQSGAAAAPRPTSQVEQKLNHLSELSSEIEDLVCKIGTRFAAVLSEDLSKENTNKEALEELCPLANNLRHENEKLMDSIEKLKTLLERIRI